MNNNRQRLLRAASLSALVVLNLTLTALVLGCLVILHNHGGIAEFLRFLQIIGLSSLFLFAELNALIFRLSAQSEINELRKAARQKAFNGSCRCARK
jgi:hypothetical protein